MLSNDEPTISLFPSSSEESLGDSDYESNRGATEILMADINRVGNMGYTTENSPVRDGRERRHSNNNHHVLQPLTEQQWEELRRRSDQALRTPITGNTSEEIALENAYLANLAKRERLDRLLDVRATRDQPSSNRSRTQLFPNDRQRHIEVMRTPLLNLAAATRTADSVQPSDSVAGEGIRLIQALLKIAMQQNTVVSQCGIVFTASPSRGHRAISS
ncbi:hypothetical protein D1007_20494 [Hordeum vulgare]|nr:hypothetical protein D1007_20494 [Hordeum vulgare]